MYVAEYSASEDWFRVDRLEKILAVNRNGIINRSGRDFVIFAVCNTREEAWHEVDQVEELLKNRRE